MRGMVRWLGLVLWVLAGPAMAEGLKPVMIYDSLLVQDKSWNLAVHTGMTKFSEKSGIAVLEVQADSIGDLNAKIRQFVAEDYNPIMISSIYPETQEVIAEVMRESPSRRFVAFNGRPNIPSAHYFVFSSQETSFLAGALAARKSETGVLGFVGGMKSPLIRNFLCGYIKGARHARPDVRVLRDFIGDDLSAWSKPDVAHALAMKQIAAGADIVFAPAGGSTEGALRAAHEAGKLGIGVDSNQNGLYPGSVLTSVMVRVDNAAFRALMAAQRNVWGDQMKVMGLQEKGIELAFDEHNAALVPDALREELRRLEGDIVLKKINLPNYVFTNTCKVGDEILF